MNLQLLGCAFRQHNFYLPRKFYIEKKNLKKTPENHFHFCSFLILGAILGDLEILPNRSVSRENYLQSGRIPDWSTVPEVEDPDEKAQQIHTRK